MSSKILTLSSILFIFQSISGQCISKYGDYNGMLEAVAGGYLQEKAEAYKPSLVNRVGLKVSSFSPITATGLTVQSDNLLIEGPLAVSGQLPFLGVVAIEGPLLAEGEGTVAYGCGDGNIGIVAEEVSQNRAKGPSTPPCSSPYNHAGNIYRPIY